MIVTKAEIELIRAGCIHESVVRTCMAGFMFAHIQARGEVSREVLVEALDLISDAFKTASVLENAAEVLALLHTVGRAN